MDASSILPLAALDDSAAERLPDAPDVGVGERARRALVLLAGGSLTERFSIVGPPSSGKSLLCSSLQQAVDNQPPPADLASLAFRPTSAAMRDLVEAAGEVVTTGRIAIDSTARTRPYEFALKFTEPVARLYRRQIEARYQLLDGPGGALFGSPSGQAPLGVTGLETETKRLMEWWAGSSGLMLCIDSTSGRTAPASARAPKAPESPAHMQLATDSALAIFRNLPRRLAELPGGLGRCRRIVICLTKADAYFCGPRSRWQTPLSRALAADPVEHALRLMTRPAVHCLATHCAPGTRIAFTYCSSYGFLAGEGTANFDPSRGGLLVTPEVSRSAASVIESWQPFRILEPLLFLATGRPYGLRVLEAGDLP